MLADIKSQGWEHDAPHIFTLDEIFDPARPNPDTWGWTEQTPDGYYTPFFETWQAGLRLRVSKWFTAFKTLGGRVDAVLLDLEACDYLNAGRSVTHTDISGAWLCCSGDLSIYSCGQAHQKNAKNESNFGASVVKMAQWPALRKHLEAVGAPFGARFSDEDMAEMKTWRTNQTDMRACEALLFRSSGGISGPSRWWYGAQTCGTAWW